MTKLVYLRSTLILLLVSTVMILVAVPGGVLTAADEPGDPPEEDVCPRIVREALDLAAKGCESTGRNEACYGHTNLEALPQPEAESFVFMQAGDIVKIAQMRSLRLGEMNEQAETWGIALLRVQASLPDTSPENVTVVLFGDTTITDNTPDTLLLPVQVSAPQNVNARYSPYSNSTVLMSLRPDTEVMATGRLVDNSWLRILLPETGQTAWVFADLMSSQEDLSRLAVVEAGSEMFRPMQAFTLESGVDDAPCVEAPQSGLIIQTPEGVGQVTFLINEVDIQMDGAVFMQAEAGNQMAVAAIDGAMTVTAGGVSQVVQPGMVVTIPLEGNSAAGVPGMPTPYDISSVQALPVSLLPQAIVVAQPYIPPAISAPVPPVNPGQPVPTAAPGQPSVPGDPGVPGQPAPTAVPGQPTQPPPPPPTAVPGQPDSDGDGYPDNVDACPTQGNQGYGVDASGCPIPPPPPPDSDGDGYPDNVDACPTQGNLGYGVDGSGCPIPPPPPTEPPQTTYTVCHLKSNQTVTTTDFATYQAHKNHGDPDGACSPTP